jgi:hypothetical protein
MNGVCRVGITHFPFLLRKVDQRIYEYIVVISNRTSGVPIWICVKGQKDLS